MSSENIDIWKAESPQQLHKDDIQVITLFEEYLHFQKSKQNLQNRPTDDFQSPNVLKCLNNNEFDTLFANVSIVFRIFLSQGHDKENKKLSVIIS